MNNLTETSAFRINGFFVIFSLIVFIFASLFFLPLGKFLIVPSLLLFLLSMNGFFVLKPNESCVITCFGQYFGTIKEAGFHWTNPFTSKQKISLKINNFHSDKLKVNDSHGNPIEIAAVIVWRVVDSVRAFFDV